MPRGRSVCSSRAGEAVVVVSPVTEWRGGDGGRNWVKWFGAIGCLLAARGWAAEVPAVAPADLVLTGGKVETMDAERPRAEAVAIRGDRIAAVGSTQEIAAFVGTGTRVIQLDGKLVIPGFIEGHGHFLGLGQSKMMLDLSTARTWKELVQQVAAAAGRLPEGNWIVGRGWHQDKWTRVPENAVNGNPSHELLAQ